MFDSVTAVCAAILISIAGPAAPQAQSDAYFNAYAQDPGSNIVVVYGHGWQPNTRLAIYTNNFDTYVRSDDTGHFETTLTLQLQRYNRTVSITVRSRNTARTQYITINGYDEPRSITLFPSTVGIRDYISLTGTGWDLRDSSEIVATFSVNDIDTIIPVHLNEYGGFSTLYRVTQWAAAPALVEVTVSDGNRVVQAYTRIIAPSITMLDNSANAGQPLTFSARNLSVYAEVLFEVDGHVLDMPNWVTDRDGRVEFTLPTTLEPGDHTIRVTTLIGPMNYAETTFTVHPE